MPRTVRGCYRGGIRVWFHPCVTQVLFKDLSSQRSHKKMFRKPAASRSRFNRNRTYPFDCVQMGNPGIGDDGRGRIWGEGMDWTGRGLGYRSDQDDGNGVSEMFGHDRSHLQRTRSFPVYGNMTRVREDSMANISPSRIWHRRHQHDQSVQSNLSPDQNRAKFNQT
ncbi:hypothetical protein DY000_02044983 [Brassica cretica]|uniref:Uncharacterized protein n=1 Tax=Brassica cretica TaxID=69181 RepID=A0ABQ7F1Z1_BRACR|nr:hypothetical protein DY000_02044983 [Brassica cretica]